MLKDTHFASPLRLCVRHKIQIQSVICVQIVNQIQYNCIKKNSAPGMPAHRSIMIEQNLSSRSSEKTDVIAAIALLRFHAS